MTLSRVLIAAVSGVLFVAAGVAAAGNFASDRQVDFFAPGMHQFYVWCSGSNDYLATQRGANAEEAQMALYNAAKAEGKIFGAFRRRRREPPFQFRAFSFAACSSADCAWAWSAKTVRARTSAAFALSLSPSTE